MYIYIYAHTRDCVTVLQMFGVLKVTLPLAPCTDKSTLCSSWGFFSVSIAAWTHIEVFPLSMCPRTPRLTLRASEQVVGTLNSKP